MRKLFTFILFCFSLTLIGCTNTQSRVSINTTNENYKGYKIQDISRSRINVETRERFASVLEKKLSGYGYQKGNELIINYDIQYFEPGNRTLRYFVGFGAGKAMAYIKTEFNNQKGKKVGQIDTEADLTIGIFGGDSLIPIENAAEDIAKKIHMFGILTPQK